MLYTGDGVYCKFCSHEGAKICCECAEILKDVPEKIYEAVRNMTPEELLALEKYLESEDWKWSG